tara:strand:- start:238 stop:417 length:180 start_codon:yes stop_codon:yes gene_type:complete
MKIPKNKNWFKLKEQKHIATDISLKSKNFNALSLILGLYYPTKRLIPAIKIILILMTII